MAFFRLDDLEVQEVGAAYSAARGPIVNGERLQLARLHFKEGTGGGAHSHPNEQIVVVLSGRIRVRIGDEERMREPGDGWRVPPGVEHQTLAVGGDVVLLSVKNLVDGGTP